MGDIHRQRQGRVAGFFHAADDVLRPLLVPMHIELEIFGVAVAAAVSSNAGWVTELMACRMPKSVAALVDAAPASGWKTCSEPIGARMAGIRSFCPGRCGGIDGRTRRRECAAETRCVEGEPVASESGFRLGPADQIVQVP